MKLQMFSIYDFTAQAYGTPFFTVNKASAQRMVSDLVNNPQSYVYNHVDDYALYFLGVFDDQDGNFETSVPPDMICRCSSLVIPISSGDKND